MGGAGSACQTGDLRLRAPKNKLPNPNLKMRKKSIPDSVTGVKLAELIGLTDRTVRTLVSKGILRYREDNKLDTLQAFKDIIAYYRSKERSNLNVNEKKAILLQMEIDEKNEELITREEQEDWQRLAIGTIANEIEAMPAKAAKLFPELDRDVAQERLMSIAKEIWDNLYKRFNNIRKHPKIENETDSEREDSGLRPLVEGSGGHVQTAEPGSGECMGA